MDLQTIVMERPKARQAFLDYRRAVREPNERELEDVRKRMDEVDRAVMRGYRELARGRQLIQLEATIAAGGSVAHAVRRSRWSDDLVDIVVPRIAIVRADAQNVWCSGIRRDGSVRFVADDHASRRRRDGITVPAGCFDIETEELGNNVETKSGLPVRALVPTVPPPFRPPHRLGNYHILFEAEWEARAPIDPALLKHLGGDLYAVLAVWDLTPLERAVLSGAPQ